MGGWFSKGLCGENRIVCELLNILIDFGKEIPVLIQEGGKVLIQMSELTIVFTASSSML